MKFIYIFLIISFSLITAASGSSGSKKNILFISVDDLRPELNCYGSTYMHTPNIDKLAANGMLFSNVYSQQAICTPSRISMLSGLRPSTTEIYKLDDKLKDKAPDVVSMPKTFKNNGYQTVSLGKIYHHQNDDSEAWTEAAWRPGSADGTWYYQGYLNSSPSGVGNDGTTLFGPPVERLDVDDNAYKDGIIAEKAIEKLEQLKDEQFFLAVGFLKPHLPFIAPNKYWDLYDRDAIEMPVANEPDGLSSFSTTTWGELRSYYGMPATEDLTEEQTKELIHGYRACVSYVDAQIGKVIDKLDQLGLREETVIVLWSDHGYKLGEYGDWCKHTNFEVDVRTPFIMDVPDMPEGLVCDRMIESVDVFPTLTDLTGIDAPPELDGLSLKPLLQNPLESWKSAAFSQYPRGGTIMGTSVRTKDYRYTEYIDESSGEVHSHELYQHNNNTPLEVETTNLVPLISSGNSYEAVRDRMRNLLYAGWARVKEGTSIEVKETTRTSVTLNIFNVGEATEIKLLMKEGDGEYSEIMPGEIGLLMNEVTISDLTEGGNFSFKLQLAGDDYRGEYSNELAVQLTNKVSLIKNGNFDLGKNESWQYNSNNGSVVSYSLISQGNDTKVLQADVSGMGKNFWDVGIINKQTNTFASEVVHISFYAQSSVVNSAIRCGMQSRTAPSVTKYKSLKIGTNWGKYEFDIDITADLRNDWQFKLFFETIATFQVDSLQASIEGVDNSTSDQWEAEADQRIQELRKGDFTIQFIGADGYPIHEKEASLKMVKHQFPFGSVIKLDEHQSWFTAVMLDYFNTGVVGNEFKWSGMQPKEEPANYDKVNRYLDWADSYNLSMKGHVLIWGGTGDNDGSDYHKLPKWVREKADGIPRTESEIEALCKTRVQETVDYYKNRIHVFDVLNESTANHADWLQNTVGTDINSKVFKWAREASDAAEFLINDYNILSSASTNPSTKIYEYAQQINEITSNAPGSVTAIGCQAHFGEKIPDRFYDNISYLYNETGLPVHITEFDLNVDKYAVSEQQQAEEYRKALKLAFSHPNVDAFMFWGFYDSNHWRDGAGMFNEDKSPKAAADAVYNLLCKEWATNDTIITDANGKIAISAFYGTYEIEVDGLEKMVEVDLTKTKEEGIIVLDMSDALVARPQLKTVSAISENQIQMVFSKKMDATTMDISSFIIHSDNEIQIANIQVAEDGLSAILEIGSPLKMENYTTISYINNSVFATDGGGLDYFGPKEIVFDNNPQTSFNEIIRNKKVNENKVQIYYNQNTLSYKVFSEERIGKIKIYDINGILLLKDDYINNSTYSFSGADLPKGLLIVVVNDVISCKTVNP